MNANLFGLVATLLLTALPAEAGDAELDGLEAPPLLEARSTHARLTPTIRHAEPSLDQLGMVIFGLGYAPVALVGAGVGFVTIMIGTLWTLMDPMEGLRFTGKVLLGVGLTLLPVAGPLFWGVVALTAGDATRDPDTAMLAIGCFTLAALQATGLSMKLYARLKPAPEAVVLEGPSAQGTGVRALTGSLFGTFTPPRGRAPAIVGVGVKF